MLYCTRDIGPDSLSSGHHLLYHIGTPPSWVRRLITLGMNEAPSSNTLHQRGYKRLSAPNLFFLLPHPSKVPTRRQFNFLPSVSKLQSIHIPRSGFRQSVNERQRQLSNPASLITNSLLSLISGKPLPSTITLWIIIIPATQDFSNTLNSNTSTKASLTLALFHFLIYIITNSDSLIIINYFIPSTS